MLLKQLIYLYVYISVPAQNELATVYAVMLKNNYCCSQWQAACMETSYYID